MYIGQHETREREKSIAFFKKKGDWHFTDNGRGAEITVDLVLQARAKMSENKVNGPEDAVVNEMIKQLPMEKIYIIKRCFQERLMGQMEAPSSWKIVKLVFSRKPDAEPKKGIRSHRAMSVMGIDGISCQHVQVMMTNLLQKHTATTGSRSARSRCP